MKIYRIIVIALTMLSWNVSAQDNGRIDLVVTDAGDTIFVMDKQRAAYYAQKIDSFDVMKKETQKAFVTIDTMKQTIDAMEMERQKLIDINHLLADVEATNAKSNRYLTQRIKNLELDNNRISVALLEETEKLKRARRWTKVFTIGGITVGAAGILYGILKQ